MSKGDCKNSVTILVMTALVLNFFILPKQEHQQFQVGVHRLKYHANWTHSSAELPHVSELQKAYKISNIR